MIFIFDQVRARRHIVYAIQLKPRRSIKSPMAPSANANNPSVALMMCFPYSSRADNAYATRVEAVALSYLQVGGRTPTVL